MDKHDLISRLKQLASELGRVPMLQDMTKQPGISKHTIVKVFGSYTLMLQAAGYGTTPSERKIDNSVFETPLERHLEEYKPRDVQPIKPWPEIAAISDLHWPFHNQRVVDRFVEYVGDVKPKIVVINGDARDQFSHAKFPRSHNVFTPEDEAKMGRRLNEEFWQAVKSVTPKSRCIQMMGNHDVRPLKRMLEAYPEAERWIEEAIRREYTFEGVDTVFDAREEVIVDDRIVIHHGYRTKLGDQMKYNLMSSIVGHSHMGGVVYRSLANGMIIFELNCGLAGDPEAKGLTYTPQKITQWTPGFGSVDRLGPRFIPV